MMHNNWYVCKVLGIVKTVFKSTLKTYLSYIHLPQQPLRPLQDAHRNMVPLQGTLNLFMGNISTAPLGYLSSGQRYP